MRRYDDTPEDRAARKARIARNLTEAAQKLPRGTVALYPEMDLVGIVTGHTTNFAGGVLVVLDGRGPNGDKGGTVAYPGELTKVPAAVWHLVKERRRALGLEGPPEFDEVRDALEDAPEDVL